MDPKKLPPPLQFAYRARDRLDMNVVAQLAGMMMLDAHGDGSKVQDVELRARCTLQLYGWADTSFGSSPRVCDLCTKQLANSANKETKRRLWEQRLHVRPIALTEEGKPEPLETMHKLLVGWRCRAHWPDWLSWHGSDTADTKNTKHATEL